MRSPSEVGLRDTFHKCSWAWSATVRPLLRRDAQERKGHVRPALQSTRLLPWAGIICVRVDSSTRRTMMTFDSIDVSFYPPILHESRCRPHRRRLYPMTPLRQTDRSPLHAASAGVFDEPNAVRAGWSCPEWQRLVAVPSVPLIGTCGDGRRALGSFNEAEFLDIVFAVRRLRARRR
jgi:hypothetical protein